MTGVELIAAERERQVTAEGWSPEHDDQHRLAELSRAALSYTFLASKQICNPDTRLSLNGPVHWPWNYSWWKPKADPIRNLVKAGALIAAEIDRLQRAAGERGVGAMSYLSLEALADGCMAGDPTNWVGLQREAKAVLAENAKLRAQVDAAEKALEVFANADNWYDLVDDMLSYPAVTVPAWRANECPDDPEEFAATALAQIREGRNG